MPDCSKRLLTVWLTYSVKSFLVQPTKAFVLTSVTLLGIITVCRLLHPPKAHSLIVITPSSSVAVVKLVSITHQEHQ